MRKRRLWIAIVVLLVAAAVVTLVLLRQRAAPEAVRLLPEADAVAYVNLGLVRLGAPIPRLPEVTHAPDYEAFVRETGFEFERDLDEVALAIHSLPAGAAPAPATPGAPALPYRSSEIVVGRFHAERVSAYLKKLATSTERHGDSDIYSIPFEGRTVRVALLGVDMVAVSNADDPAVIHGMIERYHALAQPVGGPAIVREHYARIPLGSVAWVIGRIPAPAAAAGPPNPMSMAQQMAGGSTVIGSLRYTGAIQLRLEAIAASAQDAKQLADGASLMLTLFRGAGTGVEGEGPDPDVKAFFDSIEVRQEEQSVVITATVPERAIQKLLTPPPAQAPAAVPAVPEKKKPAPPRAKP